MERRARRNGSVSQGERLAFRGSAQTETTSAGPTAAIAVSVRLEPLDPPSVNRGGPERFRGANSAFAALSMIFCADRIDARTEQESRMSAMLPHNALVVAADGAGARFFRNAGREGKIQLSAESEFRPFHLDDDGPSGARPPESSSRETDEATFAKQLARELYRRAHGGDFSALVLIADPQTLGEIRPILHKEVQSRMVSELAKTLTKASIADIEKALH
jgi:protein required for attachment to host cells